MTDHLGPYHNFAPWTRLADSGPNCFRLWAMDHGPLAFVRQWFAEAHPRNAQRPA